MSSKPLQLHGWANSPFCYKVMMALAYKGVAYEWVAAPLMFRGELQRHTGLKKVPVMRVADQWIGDSTDILRWLEREVPEPTIDPPDPRDRVQALLVEDWADECLSPQAHAAIWCPAGNSRALVERLYADAPSLDYRVGGWFAGLALPRMFRKMSTAGRTEKGGRRFFGEQLDMLEGLYHGRHHLFGDRPCTADFAIAAQLANLLGFVAEDHLARRPSLHAAVVALANLLPARSGLPVRAEPPKPALAAGA